jgi:hypothetical protein
MPPKPKSGTAVLNELRKHAEYLYSRQGTEETLDWVERTAYKYPGNAAHTTMFWPATGTASFVKLLRRDIFRAQPYQVTSKFIEVINGTWANNPEAETVLSEFHVPCQCGWAWLDDRVIFRSHTGVKLSTRVISWCVEPELPGVRLVRWHLATDLTPTSGWTEARRSEWMKTHASTSALMYMGSTVFPFDAVSVVQGDNIAAWVKTMWGLMEAEVTDITEPELRPEAVSRARQYFERPETRVRVINLRAPRHARAASSRPAGPRNYESQWVSLGYHRHKEHYIKAGGEPHEPKPARRISDEDKDTTCLTCGGPLGWVKGSLKGPDGAPIKNVEKLYRL